VRSPAGRVSGGVGCNQAAIYDSSSEEQEHGMRFVDIRRKHPFLASHNSLILGFVSSKVPQIYMPNSEI
jgi:hypothetical protein